MSSDITIICPNQRQLLCHRAVLSSRSKRLAAVFASGEYTGQHLPVSGVDSAALEAVVSSFYTGECPVSVDTVCAVHDAASKLEVPDLLQSCMNYVQQALCMDNVCTLLATAQQLKDVQIMEVCRQYIHPRFGELSGCHDFHKQSFEVAASILLDGNNSGQQIISVLHVAASWLSRQPGRDALKMPLLQNINAPMGSAAMFDDIMARMSMMHAVPVTSTPTLALGGGHGLDPQGRISVGNLVMPTNMNSRDSMNGARLLPGPGMSMANMGTLGMPGGLESPMGGLSGGMMGMNGMNMGSSLLNMQHNNGGMQQHNMYGNGMQQLIISGADGQQQLYHMAADNHQMFAPQLLNQAPGNHDNGHVIHMVNGKPVVVHGAAPQLLQQGMGRVSQPGGGDGQSNVSPGGARRPSGGKDKTGQSPASGTRAATKAGNGRRVSGAGRKAAAHNADAGASEDDHSEATRSMPTNEHSDGERTSSAARGRNGPGTGDKKGGEPPHRPSWFGGMDGVLALAEAADAAEQKQAKSKTASKPGDSPRGEGGTPQAAGGRVAELAAAGEEQPANSGNSSRRRGGDEAGEDAGDAAPERNTPEGGNKRARHSNPGGTQGQDTQQQLNTNGLGSLMGLAGDSNGNLPNATQLLSGNQLYSNQLNANAFLSGQQLPSIPNLSTLTNHMGGGLSWDQLTAHQTLSALSGGTYGHSGGMDGNGGVGLGNGSFLQSLQGLGSGLGSGLGNLNNLLDVNTLKTEASYDSSGKHHDGGGGRGKATSRSNAQPVKGFCHVDNCNADLTGLRDYHQRYKICDTHLKAPSIMRDGVPQRFCQQCGRFHLLEAFDGTRRSCRAMLQRHNARRNKRNPDALPLPAPDGPRGMYLQSVQAMQSLQNLANGTSSMGAGNSGSNGQNSVAEAMAAAAAASVLHNSLAHQLLGDGTGGGMGGGQGQGNDATNTLSMMMGLSQTIS